MAIVVRRPRPHVGQKSRGNQHPIKAVVHAIADQHDPAGGPVPVLHRRHLVALAVLGMAMAPEHQFLKDEKQRNSAQQRRTDPLDPAGAHGGDGFGSNPKSAAASMAPVAKLIRCGKSLARRVAGKPGTGPPTRH